MELWSAEALAPLVSTARYYLIHRSFYEAVFVKREKLGIAMLHGRESGRCCSRLPECERRTDLPALGRTEGSCFYPCRRGRRRSPETMRPLVSVRRHDPF